jgi:hypothetical protein
LKKLSLIFAGYLLLFSACKKDSGTGTVNPGFAFLSSTINGMSGNTSVTDINIHPIIKINLSAPVDRLSVPGKVTLAEYGFSSQPVTYSYERNDSTIVMSPNNRLKNISRYIVYLSPELASAANVKLNSPVNILFVTSIDSSDKFPLLTDNQLLDKVQQQTFKYFWDFGHPVSGMARERNTSGDLVTSGGTGFGIMAIPVAVSRNFISRSEGLTRTSLIVNFLKNNCTKYHGAFAHWINGATGATIPFSSNDNGADLVETSYLMQGLLVARQYFNSTVDPAEIDLRTRINQLWDAVEWNWFRKNNENVLYWHWSPNLGFVTNAQVRGWNEALITYVMASSSRTDSIPKIVYDNGWAGNGSIRNNNSFYGYQLPLGPPNGGPLFFEHYSFMGINPNGLNDVFANYQTQTTNHTKINYEYCKANPRNYFGYSSLCWGLTASDIPDNGYNASEPNNDVGVIAPTAALSSFAYTPVESMQALKFFYYKLGDKLWGQYGFYDAFGLKDAWFANSTLAIDQGPIIVMIENYRTGLVWDLFTGCPEIKNGMRRLGFTAPYL